MLTGYAALSELAPLILGNQPSGRVAGVMLQDLTPSQKVRLAGYTLTVAAAAARRAPTGESATNAPRDPVPHALIVASGPDEFYIAGSGVTVTFAPNSPGPPMVGPATVEEGHFADGRWKHGRVLGGDDTGQGNNLSLRAGTTTILRVTVYRYR